MSIADEDALHTEVDVWLENVPEGRCPGAYVAEQFAEWQASRKPEAAPSDTDRDFKRIPAETRAELIHMAEGRIKDVWADSPEGVDAATLASNVVAAQEFVWMQLAAGVDLRTSQPVQVDADRERLAKVIMDALDSLWVSDDRVLGKLHARDEILAALRTSQPVQVEVTDDMGIRLRSELNKHGENVRGSTVTVTVCMCGQKFATTVAGWIDFNRHGELAALSAALGGGG